MGLKLPSLAPLCFFLISVSRPGSTTSSAASQGAVVQMVTP